MQEKISVNYEINVQRDDQFALFQKDTKLFQVKNLCVAREMVKSMAVEAQVF